VLDPANNSVRYTVAGTVDPNAATPAHKYIWKAPPAEDYIYATPQAAARVVCQYHKQSYGEPYKVTNMIYYVPCKRTDGSVDTWDVQAIPNPAYDSDYKPNAPVEKHIPIDVVAAKVIANAEAGHAPSQEAVKATALEGFAAGEHDAALDAAAVPDTGVENPPGTENPPQEPAKPFDPSSIIAAINSLKALLAGILSSITSLADIFNSDSPPEKTQKETDVPVDDLPPTKNASEFDVNYINFGGQCPVLPSFNIGIGGASSALTFDMTPLCDMAVKIRPAVIAIAYFIGLGVIASAIRET
jgi:hypothetical protein